MSKSRPLGYQVAHMWWIRHPPSCERPPAAVALALDPDDLTGPDHLTNHPSGAEPSASTVTIGSTPASRAKLLVEAHELQPAPVVTSTS